MSTPKSQEERWPKTISVCPECGGLLVAEAPEDSDDDWGCMECEAEFPEPLDVEVCPVSDRDAAREELAQAMQIIRGEGLGESLLAAEDERDTAREERDEAQRLAESFRPSLREMDELRQEAERLRGELARLGSWFLTGHEPTTEELRGALVRGGIPGPDAFSEVLSRAALQSPDGTVEEAAQAEVEARQMDEGAH